MLCFLKRMSTCHQNLKGRYINIMIASLHFCTCIIALVCLIITISQEKTNQAITKDYVTLAMVLNIDNVFAKQSAAVKAALAADLKEAYCSTKRLDVDRMGC